MEEINLKAEVQHNMFLEVFPEKYFKLNDVKPRLLRKVNIKEVTINDFRENEPSHRDREPIHTIEFVMNDGEKIIEWYENMSAYGIYDDDIKEIRDKRYKEIMKQLTEV